jgi:hypothetical protein
MREMRLQRAASLPGSDRVAVAVVGRCARDGDENTLDAQSSTRKKRRTSGTCSGGDNIEHRKKRGGDCTKKKRSKLA